MHTLFKPAGLPVMPPHADPGGDCLLARWLAASPAHDRPDWPDGFAGGIAHRLDTGTSGAVAIADDPAELERLRAAFRAHALLKTYRFLAAADVPWHSHRCDRPLAHDRRHKGRMVVQRGANTPHRGAWWPASTAFRRVHDRVWEAQMRTGVTHQIRAHAAFVGVPLAGDPIYGRGEPPEGGAPFCLHHVGFTGAFATAAVTSPAWSTDP